MALCLLLMRASAAAARHGSVSDLPWALLGSVPFWFIPICGVLLQQLSPRAHLRWREQLLLLHRMGSSVYYSSLLLPGAGAAPLAAGARAPCPALPCPALPCPALPCPALPCPALPCPALPCPARPAAAPCCAGPLTAPLARP
jgi:hypothetical protein